MKDLPAELRPREKLLARGPGALSDIELLALLLRTGLKGQGVFELARQVLDEFKGFAGLLRADAADLKRIKALGPAKRAEVAAVVEMARRALAQPLRDAAVFDAPAEGQGLRGAAAGRALAGGVRGDDPGRPASVDRVRTAVPRQLTQTSVYPREIVRQALKHNAGAVILAHNHPSGVAEPSRADEYLTQAVKSALQLVDVRVLDHLVVGQGSVVSFAERGLL